MEGTSSPVLVVRGFARLQSNQSDTVFLPIIALGDYFFNPRLRGAIIGGGRLLEGGRLLFQPMLNEGARWRVGI